MYNIGWRMSNLRPVRAMNSRPWPARLAPPCISSTGLQAGCWANQRSKGRFSSRPASTAIAPVFRRCTVQRFRGIIPQGRRLRRSCTALASAGFSAAGTAPGRDVTRSAASQNRACAFYYSRFRTRGHCRACTSRAELSDSRSDLLGQPVFVSRKTTKLQRRSTPSSSHPRAVSSLISFGSCMQADASRKCRCGQRPWLKHTANKRSDQP